MSRLAALILALVALCLPPVGCAARGESSAPESSVPESSAPESAVPESSAPGSCAGSAAVFVALFSEPSALVVTAASRPRLDELMRSIDGLRPDIPPELADAYTTLADAYRHAATALAGLSDHPPGPAELASVRQTVRDAMATLAAPPVLAARAALESHFSPCLAELGR